MAKTSTFPIDAARAKTAARSVQTRFTALGHNISLNHAYEAVAAVAGFPTWAVMKPTLDNSPTGFAKMSPPAWHPFRIDDNNPAALAYGPADARRASVVASLLAENLTGKEPRHPVQVMCLGPVCPHLLAALRSLSDVGPESEVVATFGPAHGTILNIFDLPLGQTAPTEAHKRRIIDFLHVLTLGSTSFSYSRFFSNIVDRAYETALGHGRGSRPFPYARGILPDVDAHLDRLGLPKDDIPRSWHQVSDLLRPLGQHTLAAASASQAMPRLETLLFYRADDAFMAGNASVRISGELLVDLFARKVSTAIRNHAFLRRPSNFRIVQETGMTILGIEADDRDVAALIRITVENALRLASETHNKPGLQSPPFVVYGNDLEEEHAISSHSRVSKSVEQSAPIIVATGSRETLEVVFPLSSSTFITGIEKRTQVGPICSTLELDEDVAENMHAKLFATARNSAPFPVFSLLKRWIGTKTAFVEFENVAASVRKPD
jgi:hypothetical protein